MKDWLSRHFKLALGLGAAAFLALLIVGQAVAGDQGDEHGAEDVCQQFVKDRLRAPTTADFYDATTVDLGDNRWRVEGQVDAENAVGGMVQSRYVCTVTYQGDGSWQLVRVSGID